jgi:hypothetical protein
MKELGFGRGVDFNAGGTNPASDGEPPGLDESAHPRFHYWFIVPEFGTGPFVPMSGIVRNPFVPVPGWLGRKPLVPVPRWLGRNPFVPVPGWLGRKPLVTGRG